MNIGQLKKLIKDMSDDIQIMVPAHDHSFLEATAFKGTALKSIDKCFSYYTQDFGESSTPEKEFGKRITVLIVE